MRFLGLGLQDRVPDARTIWLFRQKLTTAGAIRRLVEQFDATRRLASYIAMSGQIGSVSHVHHKKPKGRAMHETTRRPSNVKSKIRSRVGHVSIDRRFGFIRRWAATDAASYAGGHPSTRC
jgi:transposase, IS5 family